MGGRWKALPRNSAMQADRDQGEAWAYAHVVCNLQVMQGECEGGGAGEVRGSLSATAETSLKREYCTR